jgi:hypothetical protein
MADTVEPRAATPKTAEDVAWATYRADKEAAMSAYNAACIAANGDRGLIENAEKTLDATLRDADDKLQEVIG